MRVFKMGVVAFSCWCFCCLFTQSCPTLCIPMDCRMPGFPVLHYHLEFVQTHVHWVGDAMQPSHPLSPSSPPALNLSRHQSFLMNWLFASGGQSIGASALASVLPTNIQCWFPLGFTGLTSLLSKGLSKSLLQHHNLSMAVIIKRQEIRNYIPSWSNSHIHTWLLGKP